MEQLFLETRTFLMRHPFAAWISCGLLLTAAARLRSRSWPAQFLIHASSAVAFTVAGLIALSAVVPTYDDHVEPTVVSAAAALADGRELYPAEAESGVHALPYGPVLYLALASWGQVAGTGVGASKIFAVLAVTLAALLLAAACRRSGARAGRTVALAAITIGCFGAATTWVRAEPLLLPIVALGIVAVTLGPVASSLLFGAALGLACGVKVTAAIFLAPLVPILLGRPGRIRTTAIVAAVASLIVLAPFLHHAIAIDGYVAIFRVAGSQSFKLASFVSELEWAALVLMPILSLLWADRRPRVQGGHAAQVLGVCCGLAIAALASKVGAWPYYFLPFVPVVCYLSAIAEDGSTSFPSRAPATAAALLALASMQGAYWVSYGLDREASQVEREAETWRARLGASIAVGYGTHYHRSFARPVLGGSHASYPFDAVTLMEYQAAGRPFPDALVSYVERCGTSVWLLPRGDPPFDLSNAYELDRRVFPEVFTSAFRRQYARAEQGEFFDVWRCRVSAQAVDDTVARADDEPVGGDRR